MKKIIAIVASIILASIIVFVLPMVVNNNTSIDANISNETSLVKQEIISYGDIEKEYNKIYAKGKLVGVATDLNEIYKMISNKSSELSYIYSNAELGLCDDVYITSEKSFINFSNVDKEIVDYLSENNFLGVKTTAVEFSTTSGVYDIIYVKDINDFYSARDKFLTNFISDDTLEKLRNNETIDSPTDLGSVEKSINMEETIKYNEAIVSPLQIFTNEKDIYNYLCYGRNTEREYYTTREGDTLQAVGYYFNDMLTKQLYLINRDVLSSENQVIQPGMKLNVTYFTSPITLDVTKEVMREEYIVPETPEYIEDPELAAGETEVVQEEDYGIKHVLYKEIWTNGVINTDGKKGSGEVLDTIYVKEPTRGIIKVGTKLTHLVGTGNFIWPIDNPYITCDYGGYPGHTGTDFVNLYVKYANVYAVDSGVVDQVGYKWDMGNYCIIDHQNGFRTFYMHFNVPPYVSVGESVSRGQVIGQMGTTGNSTGVHLHLTFEVNGTRVDSCNYLPCNLIR